MAKVNLSRISRPSKPIRCSREFKKIIDTIRARHILAGKVPPSITKITKMIAKRIRLEDLLEDEFIRL